MTLRTRSTGRAGFAQTERYSYPGLIRHVGFTHISDLIEYRQPIRTFWTERIAGRISPLRSLYKQQVARTLSAYTTADRILTTSTIQLHRNARRHVMQHAEIVTIANGEVVEIDSVCTGARPA